MFQRKQNEHLHNRSDNRSALHSGANLGSHPKGVEGLQDRKGPARYGKDEGVRRQDQDPADSARRTSDKLSRCRTISGRLLNSSFFRAKPEVPYSAQRGPVSQNPPPASACWIFRRCSCCARQARGRAPSSSRGTSSAPLSSWQPPSS